MRCLTTAMLQFLCGISSFHAQPSVPIQEWESWKHSNSRFSFPTLLTGSVVDQWAAKHWSPGSLLNKAGNLPLKGVYVHSNPVFGPYFDASRVLNQLSTVSPRNQYEIVSISPNDFFGHVFDPNPKKQEGDIFMYLSTDIGKIGAGQLEADIHPVSPLLLSPRSSINLWIGQNSTQTPCHYDGYYNLFVQIAGTKRFKLWPPTAWRSLRPFPYLHPSHAQCSVGASAALEPAFEVTLNAGGHLFIPPFWFHEVEALAPSISVNVWSDERQDTGEAAVMGPLFRTRPPVNKHVGEFQSQGARATAMAALIVLAVREVQADQCASTSKHSISASASCSSPRAFLRDFYEARFRILVEEGELPSEYSRVLFLSPPYVCAGLEEQSPLHQTVAAISQLYISDVSGRFSMLTADTVEMWLGNYLEFLAVNAVGVSSVGVFFADMAACMFS